MAGEGEPLRLPSGPQEAVAGLAELLLSVAAALSGQHRRQPSGAVARRRPSAAVEAHLVGAAGEPAPARPLPRRASHQPAGGEAEASDEGSLHTKANTHACHFCLGEAVDRARAPATGTSYVFFRRRSAVKAPVECQRATGRAGARAADNMTRPSWLRGTHVATRPTPVAGAQRPAAALVAAHQDAWRLDPSPLPPSAHDTALPGRASAHCRKREVGPRRPGHSPCTRTRLPRVWLPTSSRRAHQHRHGTGKRNDFFGRTGYTSG